MSNHVKDGVKKGAWSSEEDELLTLCVKLHGQSKWRSLAQKAGDFLYIKNYFILLFYTFYLFVDTFMVILLFRFEKKWEELQAPMAELFEAWYKER